MLQSSVRTVLLTGLLFLIISIAPVPVQSGKPPCPQGGGGALNLVLNLIIPTASACPPVFWSKSYGNAFGASARSVKQTPDGGFVVVGSTADTHGGAKDFRVVRLDADGNIVWQKTYGGSDADEANSVQLTQDGGYIVAGRTYSSGTPSNYNVWVIRLDGAGNIAWQKLYGGSQGDGAFDVQTISDGGFAVAGYTRSFGAGDADAWILRLDPSGNVVWQKAFGGAGLDNALSIRTTSDDGFVVTGYTLSFGAGDYDVWVLRLDGTGNIVWQSTYGGTGYDTANSVQQTSDGGFVVAGLTMSFGVGNSDTWILRLDSSGNVVWQKTYGGTGSDSASSLDTTADGGFVVAGTTSSFGDLSRNVWLLRLDANGNIIWQKTYGGTFYDEAYSVQVTSGGALGRGWQNRFLSSK